MGSNSFLVRAGARVSGALLLLAVCVTAAAGASGRDQTRGAKTGGTKAADGFAKLEGMRVHYRSHGKGDEALVFVHGWTCDLSFWRLQVPAFEGKTRVVALDLPGHGRSDKPEVSYTMDLFARAVEAVMRDAGVKRAVLVGHSMGVPVVRQFYRKFPGKTLGLVFVDGSLWPFAPRAAMEQFMAPMRADYKQAAAQMVEGMVRPMRSAALREEVKAAMLSAPRHVAVSAMEGMMDESLWKEDPIKVPALAVLARSPFWPADAEQRFKKIAPALDYRMWDGASHFLMMDKPEEFNRELSDFLARHKLLRQK
jgi:pimeloyl-ACP methyl ester carboxylesterase